MRMALILEGMRRFCKKLLLAIKSSRYRWKDKYVKERLRFHDYRDVTARKQTEIRKLAIMDLIFGLLVSFDNLGHAAACSTGDRETLRSGVELVRQDIISFLATREIKITNPLGLVFHPETMEAVAVEEREGLNKQTVVEVLSTGCLINGVCLRPARVKVGIPPTN